MKLDDILFTVSETLRENGIKPEVAKNVLNELKKVNEQTKEEKTPSKRAKKQLVAYIIDENNLVKEPFIGYIMEIEDSGNPSESFQRVKEAAKNFNSSRKGRKIPVKTVGQTFEFVPKRFWKQEGKATNPKTKNSIYVYPAKNQLDM